MSRKNNWALLSVVGTVIVIIVTFPLDSLSEDSLRLPDGSNLDLAQKCPVCGMVISGTDRQAANVTFEDGRVVGFHGVAAAVFNDGHVVGFEGARCLFIYNSIPQKYNVNVADIARQYVTDYATKKMIELPRAFLVLGSEVKGPMGYELIPFSSRDEAAKFASENDGKWIVQLQEVAKAAQKDTNGTGASQTPETRGMTEKDAPIPTLPQHQIQQQDRSLETPARPPILPSARGGGGC